MNTIKGRTAMVLASMLLVASVAFASTPQPTSLEKVRKQLVTLPYYGVFDNLEYKVEGNTVTLSGQVLKPMKVRTSLRVLCETLIRRGDPELAFTARLDLPLTRNNSVAKNARPHPNPLPQGEGDAFEHSRILTDQ
jgi:hypothetical protein